MPLQPGDKLGHYEVLSLLGVGGMGEVYRARDTTLKRDVALKVLPEAFARDPERMARFQREAEVLASLNHPNIAAIYGVEDRALVMELVEGSPPKGPLPFDDAWKIASQIAAALEYAHEKSIVHRDLKPANIKVTPDGVVKLLDFGLAKAFSSQPDAQASPENSPTLTIGATQAGVILGTAAYMSPEQAKGKQVDKRADIWAFGVVLFELLTGERLFKGEDVSDTLAQVLTKEPDLNKVPTKARKLLLRCLEKDPKKRLRDVGEAAFLLDDAPEDVPARKRSLPWVAVTLALAIVAVTASWIAWRATGPVDHLLIRLSVDLGPDSVAGPRITVAISPDGARVAFPMRGSGGKQQLATRLLDQAEPTLLAGTENGIDPFFSPDGQWIGFSADGKLKKISVLGGAALALCDAPSLRGASWDQHGNIVATLNNGSNTGLSRVPAGGGMPQTLTNPAQQGGSHRWPQVLPGGEAILFTGNDSTGGWDNADIEVLSLKSGQTRTLLRGGYFGRYLPSYGSTGHLVYIHEGVLFGMPFDLAKLEVRGTPAPLLQDVAGDSGTGGGQFDVSRTGTLVYLSGKPGSAAWPVVWLDSSGKTEPLVAKPGNYYNPRLSPDGNLLALSVLAGKTQDIYIYDWRHDTMPRLTFTPRNGRDPVWTPDGKHIVFDAPDGLWWIRADGAGEAQRLMERKNSVNPLSFSPDGTRLVYGEQSPETHGDIWTLPLDLSDAEHPKAGKPEPFLHTAADEILPKLSHDGRWMAYGSDESGAYEVYVRPFPGPGGKWQISTGGGDWPIWSRDGRELFYATQDNRIMVTEYMAKGESFSYTKPRTWSEKQIRNPGRTYFDLAPDGKRFVVFPRAETSEYKEGSVRVTFLLNFFDEVRRRVPVSGK